MPQATLDRRGPRWRPSYGVWVEGDGVVARLWAPDARTASLERRDRRAESLAGPPAGGASARVPLAPEGDGFFSGSIPDMRAGDRYAFVLDDQKVIADPASRFQPEGVHGPSEIVDTAAFAWRHQPPGPLRMDEQAIYELHIGTFTEAGVFASAAAMLPRLADLGVTAVELMPIAAFAGRRNWGYDGAALFAPSEAYGTPDDLHRFVDRAHGLGLAVILDVVYNHFGPDGAAAAEASARFFSDRHESPWGRGINLDGPDSGLVRRFFIDNALMWLVDYRIDGLRLDATHALVDDSPRHFLAELAGVVRQVVERDVLLIAEDHRNLRTLVDPPAADGFGLDAVWADDFHHSVRRLVAGDDEAYYRDYQGTLDEVARTLRGGWLYRGDHSVHHDAPRGTDPTGLELSRFVIALQNHDQVGNRALGDRLNDGVDTATWRALSVLLLMAPETPLLFMGQEWAASSPFLYFTDHEPALGRLVSAGRRDEFRLFRAFADPERRARIPDPQALETFLLSKLDWQEIAHPPHAGTLALYRELLALRRRLAPAGKAEANGSGAVASVDGALVLRRRTRDGHELSIVVCPQGAGRVVMPAALEPHAPWTVRLDTESERFATDPVPSGIGLAGGFVDFTRPGAVVLEARAPSGTQERERS